MTLYLKPAGSLANETGRWRKRQPEFHDKWPPCGQVCPATEDIQAIMSLASQQLWELAWRKLTERNPMPAVLGRVCYHPCEQDCNRAQFDQAVNIHAIERFLGDMAIARGWKHQSKTVEKQKRKIAVVGGGPAGLSCAFHLLRNGYPVTLFEAESQCGGALQWGIPDYRLPKSVLQKEIEAIVAMGVELKTGYRVGRDVSAEDLRSAFNAVFIAPGASKARIISDHYISGQGVETGMAFLRRVNCGEYKSLPDRVVVVGGGNTAIDAARCARRFGAQVQVICPQLRPAAGARHHREQMPAIAEEVVAAEAEGVIIMPRTGLMRIVRNGEHLAGLEVAKVGHVYDQAGEFNPLLYEGTEQFLPAELIVLATGQEVDWSGLEGLREQRDGYDFVIGGDAAGRPRMAANAIGSGHHGARLIMAFLTGIPTSPYTRQFSEVPYQALNTHYFEKVPREVAASKVASKRVRGFSEVNENLTEEQVLVECNRCFSCGNCFECDNCWHFCPDGAIHKIGDGEGYEVDYQYCKGCGICALECPCGHIDMMPLPELGFG